ncbi:hypothetical protein JQX14_03150 [Sulfitobacter pseudonitzschiae]|uniref:Uncharacterized protein n=1 Tax=Pseudosulfitobacter pseudonitzschiae TaxID=1402135 RepID=A0A9Q2NFF0_9RHOB|nr:hypothetical protein [Pseudosulfitobacter pseudonitzschiae]
MASAEDFLIAEDEAIEIIKDQISIIAGEWDANCEIAGLSPTDKSLFAGRQFLNPYCVEGLGNDHAELIRHFERARAHLTG